ncbi:MAG: patatin-like phospholipase RssA [Deltaproteobacteria bacterium]|nr:patatin-like phospholipase RssA [Deltaproteobacteria bacterium]
MTKTRKIGLALGSGSARGWSHIGVIQGLREEGIPIDVVCGTSIGSVVGGALAAGTLDQLDEWVRDLSWSDVIGFMDVMFPRSGFIEGEKIINFFRKNFADPNIEDLSIPFAAVATDLMSGREIWLKKGSLMDAVRASISMPGMFAPFKQGGQWLVDGGLVNPVPVSLCRAMGADIVIAVNLNSYLIGKRGARKASRQKTPPEKRETTGKLREQLTSYLNSTIKKGKSFIPAGFGSANADRSPSIFEVMATSTNIMQDRITRQRLAGDPSDLLISPRLAHIGLLEFNRADEIIREGKHALELMLPLLKDVTG